MTTLGASQLAAFALVADEYQASGDAVRGLKPLFASALSGSAGERFCPQSFSNSYLEMFGISISPHVARSLEPKLIELGLLEEAKGGPIVSKLLLSFKPSLDGPDSLPGLLSAFSKWASSQLESKGLAISEAELEGEFLLRLARPEFAASFFDESDEQRRNRLRSQLLKSDALAGKERDTVLDYLSARFIAFADQNLPDVFQELAKVSSGALIAEAVAGLASPASLDVPKEGLRIVVDGPLLLDYLDLNTPEQHSYVKSMLEELRELGFSLATFDHVFDEMRQLITAALKEFSQGREYGPLGDRLRSELGFALRATTVRDSMESRLESELGLVRLRYEIYDRGDRDKYFSPAQIDSLRNSLGHAHHQVERRERDAKSIAGVIRMKKDNRRPSSVFQAGTIFLTRNSRLYKDASRYLSIGREDADPRFSVVLDSQLLPTIWFSRGASQRFVEMSRSRLIANCAAAMVPQREVVHKLADFLSGISKELKDEFSALMADGRAKLCPMSYTLGCASVLDQDAARQVVEIMRAELAAPIIEESSRREAELREQVERLQNQAAQSKQSVVVVQGLVEASNFELAQAILDREELASQRRQRDAALVEIAEADERKAAALRSTCASQVSLVRRAIGWLIWIVIVVSALYGAFSQDPGGLVAAAGTLVAAFLFGRGQQRAEQLIGWCMGVLHRSKLAEAEYLCNKAQQLRANIR